MAVGTPTTVYQATDTFIVDVAWLDADVTDTVIPHGLLGTPQEVTQSIRVATATGIYPIIDFAIDGTNLTASKASAVAQSGCTVRYVCRRMTHSRA